MNNRLPFRTGRAVFELAAQAARVEAAKAVRESAAFKLALRINDLIVQGLDAEWTTGDGSRVKVQAMADAHLFFAIAKAYRAESPDSRSRATGIDALKAEAMRRLLTWSSDRPEITDPPHRPANPKTPFDLAAIDARMAREDEAMNDALGWGRY